MENVKISVLMPVYNTNKKYLKQSIESILKQTFKDFEFIIIDDGSDIKKKKFLVERAYKNRLWFVVCQPWSRVSDFLKFGYEVFNSGDRL